ncbi:MAG TPA: phosphoglucosamine mutase [Terriglobia bacterium]|nr:phosphoglucosamine mutase [Terriglobia bacterium]
MGSKPELFGTDGIRGVAGEYPLDQATVRKIGTALGTALRNSSSPVRVVLGKDTRESNEWISRVLAGGLASTGAEVFDAGIIPTPGVAFLARQNALSAGVMVSASHNPYQDNGIKVFSPEGTKLPEARELEIERLINTLPEMPSSAENAAQAVPGWMEEYVEHLACLVPAGMDFSPFLLVVDCAHGAASRVAPLLMARLGIKAKIFNAEPNGRNINQGCGSLHPEMMAETTRAAGADLGVALDGDADRAIFATHDGRLADGDHVLFAVAPLLARHGSLKGGAVVGTLMTNLALELALARQGIGLKRTAVGDKYVLEEMLRSGISLGGEPSGHIIFSDLSLAGDGLITLLEVLRLQAETRQPFGQLLHGYRPFPQLIRNVRVGTKTPLDSIPSVAQAIAECCLDLGDRGRVVVRYSGTEPLARVMVEGEEMQSVEDHTTRIASAIQAALGT